MLSKLTNMENIYIGDIHGLNIWEDIVKQHPNADNITFIGDYLDSFDISGIEQLFNLENIVQYKKDTELNSNIKVHLLIGNHDLHYWPGIKDRDGVSGFQPTMLHQFEYFFRQNQKMFKMAVQIGHNLCTHAGVTETFLKDVGYYKEYDGVKYVEEFLNEFFHHKPNEFDFYACYDRHYGLMSIDPYGNNIQQSPVWVRPNSLMKDNKGGELKNTYIQIVGHTKQNTIDIKGKSTGGRYYFIDTLPRNQYLIEKDGEFSIGYIN